MMVMGVVHFLWRPIVGTYDATLNENGVEKNKYDDVFSTRLLLCSFIAYTHLYAKHTCTYGRNLREYRMRLSWLHLPLFGHNHIDPSNYLHIF